jgi:hypothetical protein
MIRPPTGHRFYRSGATAPAGGDIVLWFFFPAHTRSAVLLNRMKDKGLLRARGRRIYVRKGALKST